jgi:hypothetical protein
MNPFRRILLGAGRLPEALRGEVMADGVLLLEESLRGSVTYRTTARRDGARTGRGAASTRPWP